MRHDNGYCLKGTGNGGALRRGNGLHTEPTDHTMRTLVRLGTRYYWRDDEDRCFIPLHNPAARIPFSLAESAHVRFEPVACATDLPLTLGQRAYTCDDCRESFAAACHCNNTPQPDHRLRRRKSMRR
jgi:hypothetical protein